MSDVQSYINKIFEGQADCSCDEHSLMLLSLKLTENVSFKTDFGKLNSEKFM